MTTPTNPGAPLPPAPTPEWPQLTDSERVAHNDALWLRLFTRPHDMDCLEEYRKYLLPGDVARIREIADRILQVAAPPAGEGETPNVTTAWPQYWLCTVCMRSRRGDEDCPYCRIAALEADAATHARALAEAQELHLASEWHDDIGSVLWWVAPGESGEPPYCGTPLDNNFPGYQTHWSRLIVPPALTAARSVSPREGAE